MERGQYYLDSNACIIIIFEEEQDNIFWFYCPEEDRHVAYYDFEIKNLRRY